MFTNDRLLWLPHGFWKWFWVLVSVSHFLAWAVAPGVCGFNELIASVFFAWFHYMFQKGQLALT